LKTKYLIYILFGLITLTLFIEPKSEEKIIENDIVFAANIEQTEEVQTLYYGKTKEELIDQINKSLNSTLSNKGDVIVNYSLEYDVDPYLVTAIILHETGCKWQCSNLVKSCNNVAGQKGSPSCNGGSYKKYDTLDEGIEGAIYNISINYIQKGLTTPEQIGPKYAASTTWASKINYYINEIKSK
jgi:hypothetical protein